MIKKTISIIGLISLFFLVGCASSVSQSKLSAVVDSMNSRSTTLQRTDQKVNTLKEVKKIKEHVQKPTTLTQ